MADEKFSVKDVLAGITAECDQAQATINEARKKFPDDLEFQTTLDLQQLQLDLRVARIGILRRLSEPPDP